MICVLSPENIKNDAAINCEINFMAIDNSRKSSITPKINIIKEENNIPVFIFRTPEEFMAYRQPIRKDSHMLMPPVNGIPFEVNKLYFKDNFLNKIVRINPEKKVIEKL